jgi:hypothetical protein
MRPPTNSAADELPAEEDPEDDSDLEDEVRRGELEGHGCREARALLEHRLGDRHRRVAAGRRRRAQARREQQRAKAAAAKRMLHPLAWYPRLHDAREKDAKDERPPHFPRPSGRRSRTLADELERVHSVRDVLNDVVGQVRGRQIDSRTLTSDGAASGARNPAALPPPYSLINGLVRRVQ